MPIRHENRKRYPADWPEIRARILARAENKCERCAAPNGAEIGRGEGRHAGTYLDPLGHVRDETDGRKRGSCRDSDYQARAYVTVVLTIAHLDHTPENCDPANLQALCQKCHNRLDAKMRAAGIKARRRDARAAADLFQE